MNEVPQDSSLSHWNQLAKLEFENLYKEIEQNAKNVFLVINIRYCELNGNHRCSAYIEAASAPNYYTVNVSATSGRNHTFHDVDRIAAQFYRKNFSLLATVS